MLVLWVGPVTRVPPSAVKRGSAASSSTLAAQQDAEIAEVVSERAGHDRVLQLLKQRIGVEVHEGLGWIKTHALGPVPGLGLGYRACRGAVAVHTIGTRTEKDVIPAFAL